MPTKTKIVRPMTKNALKTTLSEATGLPPKQVGSVLDALAETAATQVRKGPFLIPGIAKLVVINKKATKAREMKSPFNGEMIQVAAKPARKVVRARPVKSIKEAVA